jgi:GAF domain-containing protein
MNQNGFSVAKRLTPQLYIFLANAIELLDADKGNVQFYDEPTNTLKIVAHIGFNDEFLREFETVVPGRCACGIAMKSRQRVIVEDTSKDPSFKDVGSTLKRFGFAAVQSTPLFGEDSKFFGMLSTHFAMPHVPGSHELRMLDQYLERSAPLLARKWAEARQHPFQP